MAPPVRVGPELSAEIEGGGSIKAVEREGREEEEPFRSMVTSRGAWEEDKRAASVTVRICVFNHDLESRELTYQPCVERRGEPNRDKIGQKKAPLEGGAGPSARSELLARREHIRAKGREESA